MTTMGEITKDWITTSEAATRLRCSVRTVQRLAETGRIRSCAVSARLYLVRLSDVEREAVRDQHVGRPRGT
jgi:excisionase family DNA binding protein